jgi:protein SCO1/2
MAQIVRDAPEGALNVPFTAMAARIQLTLAAALALVALALAGVLLFGGKDDNGPSFDVAGTGFAGAVRSAQIPPADFTLTDQDGRRVALHDTRGTVTVLTFMYSTCLDSCPVVASQIRGALDDLKQNVPVLAISVDPANDTQLQARRFVNKQSLTGRMRFLLGSRAQLAPIWKQFAIQPQGKNFEHSAYVLLIDKQGRQRVAFPFDHLAPEPLAHDIARLERE